MKKKILDNFLSSLYMYHLQTLTKPITIPTATNQERNQPLLPCALNGTWKRVVPKLDMVPVIVAN